MILLDTSVLIELFRTKDKRQTLFYKLSEKEDCIAVSSITHYEIFVGMRQQQSEFWDSLFEMVKVIPFDTNSSFEAVKIYKQLKLQNKLIELPDMLIGATAVANNIPLATLNLKHFGRISGLAIVTS